MTLRMYAKQKNFALLNVEIQLNHVRIHAKDLDEAQRERLLQIATRCPVHRTLSSEIKIRTTEV